MPYKQQKKLNKTFCVTLIFLALILSTFFWPASYSVKAIGATLFVLIFVFIRRGYIQFTKGMRLIRDKGQTEAGFCLFEKALKSGVSNEYKSTIASIMIQYGNPKRGCEILEEVRKKAKEKHEVYVASVVLSMGYFADARVEDAIKILEEVQQKGYGDNNLFINLSNYYLYAGDLPKAKKQIIEAKKAEINVPGMMDNYGWYHILDGEWAKAKKIYDKMIDENPSFPDAYVHACQVAVHEKQWSKAVEYLDFALTKRFSFTSCFSKDYVEKLKKLLSNSKKREEVAISMDQNCHLVSCGKEFGGYFK